MKNSTISPNTIHNYLRGCGLGGVFNIDLIMIKARIKKLNKAIYSPYKPTFVLTRRIAKQVRYFRVTRGFTWRAVAREMHDRYSFLNINRGNQIDGAFLCDDAMRLLKEHVNYNGWN